MKEGTCWVVGPYLTKRVFVFCGDDHPRNHGERLALPKLKASLAAHTAHKDIEDNVNSNVKSLWLY